MAGDQLNVLLANIIDSISKAFQILFCVCDVCVCALHKFHLMILFLYFVVHVLAVVRHVVSQIRVASVGHVMNRVKHVPELVKIAV